MQQRLANIIYILTSITAGVLMVAAISLFMLGSTDRSPEEVRSMSLFLGVFLPPIAWAIGWTLRYIMTGNSGAKLEL